MMPLTHGRSFVDPKAPYESSAFFIRHDLTKRHFLFFGDVEPDTLSVKPQTIAVWRAAARLVPQQLNTIFLECSWPSDRDDALLFGHLSPKHVLHELEAFADEVLSLRFSGNAKSRAPKRQRTDRSGALKGLTLYIIHCKAALNGVDDQSQLIAHQIRTLVHEQELGIKILAVVQGMRIGEQLESFSFEDTHLIPSQIYEERSWTLHLVIMCNSKCIITLCIFTLLFDSMLFSLIKPIWTYLIVACVNLLT